MSGYAMGVGQRLAEYRERSGRTQEELAHDLDTKRRTYQDWERGLRLPAAEALVALAREGCDLRWLLLGEERVPLGEWSEADLAVIEEAARLLREAGLSERVAILDVEHDRRARDPWPEALRRLVAAYHEAPDEGVRELLARGAELMVKGAARPGGGGRAKEDDDDQAGAL